MYFSVPPPSGYSLLPCCKVPVGRGGFLLDLFHGAEIDIPVFEINSQACGSGYPGPNCDNPRELDGFNYG